MSKKILIVGQHFWPESFRINDIADFLVNEKGCTVDVLCGLPNYPSGKFPDGYGYFKKRHQIHNKITIYRALEIPRGNNSNLRIFLNYISFPIASLFHIPRLLTKKYDKIFIYQLSPVMMSIAGIIIGKIKKTETTMYVLDLWPENLFSVVAIENKTLRTLITKVSHWHYKKVDKIIVLSEQMKTKLQDVTGIENNGIAVIPQSSEKLYEQNVVDEVLEKKFQSTFNIVFTGNISPAQSFDTILSAAQRLKTEHFEDIKWIIVGDGMSRKPLEQQIKKLDLNDVFTFEGHKPIEDVPKYTNIADLLVGCLVKSDLLEATVPAKVMSYIAAGKPIVLAMDGEVRTLINDTIKCGFAGPAGDDDTFYTNVKKIYQSTPSRRIAMGSRARNYHLKHFERNIILTKMYDFIFNLSKV